MTHPVVSICIANYNGERLLQDCLDSVCSQQGDFELEVLVHDDASTDRSLELLRSRYPRVQRIASTGNVGFCIANNRMVERARGEYVLLLNNDAALGPGAIATLLSAARALGDCVLTLPQYDWESGELVDRGCLLDPLHTPVPNLDPARVDVAYVAGACLFTPRALWQRLGGLPAWMESLAEDLHYCCRARLRGVPVRCVGGGSYRHRQGASFGGSRLCEGRLVSRYRRRYLSERNRMAAALECTPTGVAWLLFVAQVLLLAVEGLLVCVAGRSTQAWRRIYGPALWHVLGRLGEIRARRRTTQAMRAVSLRRYFAPFVRHSRKLQMLRRHGWPRLR